MDKEKFTEKFNKNFAEGLISPYKPMKNDFEIPDDVEEAINYFDIDNNIFSYAE